MNALKKKHTRAEIRHKSTTRKEGASSPSLILLLCLHLFFSHSSLLFLPFTYHFIRQIFLPLSSSSVLTSISPFLMGSYTATRGGWMVYCSFLFLFLFFIIQFFSLLHILFPSSFSLSISSFSSFLLLVIFLFLQLILLLTFFYRIPPFLVFLFLVAD